MKNLFVILACVMAFGLVFSPIQSHAVGDPQLMGHENIIQPVVEGAQIGDVVEHQVEEKKGGLPQLNIATYPSQIFWLLVMFVVLYVTFSKSILPTIGSVVNARDMAIKGNLDDAENLKNRAQNIQADYEKSLSIAKANASKAVQDVEIEAKKKAAEQVENFRKKADTDIKAAELRVLKAKDKAMGDMTLVAADVASMAAEKITGIGTNAQNAHDIVASIANKAKAA